MTPEFILLESVRNGSPVPHALFHETCDETISSFLLSCGCSVAEIDAVLAALDPLLFGEKKSFCYDSVCGSFGNFLFDAVCRCAASIRDIALLPARERWEEEWKKHVIRQSLLKLRREMPPDEYLAFEVYVVEGKPAREAAVLSSMSPEMVYFIKTRALRRLRALRHEFEAV